MGHVVTPRTISDESSPALAKGPGVLSPDLQSEGWVSQMGPNGRMFWHHLSLGRAPWDRPPPTQEQISDTLFAPAKALAEQQRQQRQQQESDVKEPSILAATVNAIKHGVNSTASDKAFRGGDEEIQFVPCNDVLDASFQARGSTDVLQAAPGHAESAGIVTTVLPEKAPTASCVVRQVSRMAGLPARASFPVFKAYPLQQSASGMHARASFPMAEAMPHLSALPARASFQVIDNRAPQAGLDSMLVLPRVPTVVTFPVGAPVLLSAHM